MNDTLTVISQRKSIRNFLPDMPDDAHIRAIVEAGRAAPSGFNRQARYFAVIRNRQLIEEVNDAVKEVAATHEDEFFHRVGKDSSYDVFYHAPALIVVAGDGSLPLVEQDCAASNQNMLIAAKSLGLGACWINFTKLAFEGPRSEEMRKKLHIPEGYTFFCSVAVGHEASERSAKKVIQGNEVRFFD